MNGESDTGSDPQGGVEAETPGLGFLGYFGLWVGAALCAGFGCLLLVQVTTPSSWQTTSSGGDSEVSTDLTALFLVFLTIPCTLVGVMVAAAAAASRPRAWVFSGVSFILMFVPLLCLVLAR